MSNQLKPGRYSIETRLPYEKSRVEEVESLIAAGINPLSVTISTVGGDTKLTMRDIINYLEFRLVPFIGTISSFTLEGENDERKANLR